MILAARGILLAYAVPSLMPQEGWVGKGGTLGIFDRSRPLKRRIKTLIAIYTCNKFLNVRVPILERTWASATLPEDVEIGIFLGDDGKGSREEGRLVYLPCPDDYANLPVKTLALIRYAANHFEFSTLVKVDDDVYVPDLDRLLLDIGNEDYVGSKQTREGVYRTRAFPVGRKPRLPIPWAYMPNAYMSGGTYSLSRRLVDHINLLDHTFTVAPFVGSAEDVMVGWLVEQSAVTMGGTLTVRHDPGIANLFYKPLVVGLALCARSRAIMDVTPRRHLILHFFWRRFPRALSVLLKIGIVLLPLLRLRRRVRKRYREIKYGGTCLSGPSI